MGKVLIACEYSGIVRDAFIAAGHDATSCDLLPTQRPGPHIQGDVRELLREPWDLVIAHPPCTYLTGYTWAFKNQWKYLDWWQNYKDALHLFRDCWNANAPMVAVENPAIMHPPARAIIGPPDQITDFRYFEPGVRKRVGWWLNGLPPLMAQVFDPAAISLVRDDVSAKMAAQRGYRPCHDGLVGYSAGISKDRSKLRSAFQPGMAAAMATQWGCFLQA